MLSVFPADVTALIANQTYGSFQQTNTAHSIASDNAGDFAVAWTRQDPILDASGNPITNPATGLTETVSDVRARYFTQTVQQITLPAGAARFSLTDNDQTIDQISVTTGTAPAGADGSATATVGSTTNPISGTFNLFYNATGNDTVGQQDAAALPPIQYVAGTPAMQLTFANSVSASAVNQKLTFSTTESSPVNGDFDLQVGTATVGPIYFDNTSLTTLGTTAADMQTALQNNGFTAATVTLDPSSTTKSAIFDVAYTGTQSDLLTVNYDSFDSAVAATQIQAWLNGFAPVTGVSDATHAIVNAIDPYTFVVDFGAATQGLDQSALLQYLSSEATPTTTQTLTFASTAGYTITPADNTVVPPVPAVYTFNPINGATTVAGSLYSGSIALQVGTVQTGAITFDVDPANLAASTAATATAMQNALNALPSLIAAGVTATVTGTATVTTVATALAAPGVTATFTVTFTSAEPPVQYVPLNSGFAIYPGVPANFTNSADTTTLSSSSIFVTGLTLSTGFLPTVQITTLDKPFTVNNIPVSSTNATLTAEAISNYFHPAPIAGTQAVAPFDFPPPQVASNIQNPYPYYEPVAVNPLDNVAPTTPLPFVTVAPVINADGTASTTQFDVTFSGISGTLVDAPIVITNAVNVYGNALGTKIIGGEGVPTGSTGASVTVLKASGNEYQVNAPQAIDVYNSGTALNSDQPAVAMDGSGNFVVAWREEIPQQLAPKDITDIYFRRYAPMGITTANVPGEQFSDVVGNLTSEPYFTGIRALAAPDAAVDAGVQSDDGRPLHGHFRAASGNSRDGADFFFQRGPAHQRGQHRGRPGEYRLRRHAGHGGWRDRRGDVRLQHHAQRRHVQLGPAAHPVRGRLADHGGV